VVDLSIVIPVWADDVALERILQELRTLQELQSLDVEVVVVEAGGDDDQRLCDVQPIARMSVRKVTAVANRGAQIAAGIALVRSDWIWVLHADTQELAGAASAMSQIVGSDRCWGRFDVRIPGLGAVAYMMNVRSRITKICTGDQAMFFHTRLLEEVGGYPPQPLMEDVELSKRLKAHSGADFKACQIKIIASGRRWHRRGIARTILSMWSYRLRYFFGADPTKLYEEYYQHR
jgi:glycosyltransferase involved in cell wall biosynthesis